jgi:outer membrane protein assembly factor BamB
MLTLLLTAIAIKVNVPSTDMAVHTLVGSSTTRPFFSSVENASILSNGGFENWSGKPLLPDSWFIVSISSTYDPASIHESSIAFEGSYSLRLGGQNSSEVGYDLAVIIAQDVPVDLNMSYLLAFHAFGSNSAGSLAGGIRVDWLDAVRNVIGQAIPRVSLPTGGVSSYTSFVSMSSLAPSGTVYARVYAEKKSWGFINFDDVIFTPADTWPMIQHDRQHTGYSLDTSVGRAFPLSKIWEYSTSGQISAPPVVSYDGVYVARGDGLVYRLDPFTGTLKWSFPKNLAVSVPGNLAVNQTVGHVYACSLNGNLTTLRSGDGSILWSRFLSGKITGANTTPASPVPSEGFIYTGGYNATTKYGTAYKVNETNGHLNWSFTYPTTFKALVDAAAVDSGTVYAPVNTPATGGPWWLFAINDLPSPSWKWSVSMVGPVGLPAFAYGNVYVCTDASLGGSAQLYGLNKANGRQIWNKTGWAGPFAAAYGRIYITVGNRVYALSATTGNLDPGWTVYTANAYSSGAYTIVANGVVYAVIARSEPVKSILVALNATTGDKLWELTANAVLMPVTALGSLYISSSKGMVYCYSYDPSVPPTRYVDAIAVWSHNTAAGSPLCNDTYYSIYDATNDLWWSLQAPTAAPVARLALNDYWPAIAFDHCNNALAVWAHDTGGTLGYDLYYSEWGGSAVGWTPALPVATLSGNDTDPAVALWDSYTGENGVAVWCHGKTVYYAQWDGSGWSMPACLVSSWPKVLDCPSKLPEITYDVNHNAVAVWTDGKRPETPLQVYYSIFNGSRWTSPAAIPGQPVNASWGYRKGIASDGYGNAVVVWNSEESSWDNQYAVWNGVSFGNASAICPSSVGNGTAIAFDASWNAFAVYGTCPGPPFTDVLSNQMVGGWQQPRPASGSSTRGMEPRVAFLLNGKAIAVWCGQGPTDYDIMYSIWDPSSGAWTPKQMIPTGFAGADAPLEGPVSIASNSGSPTMPPIGSGGAVARSGGNRIPYVN